MCQLKLFYCTDTGFCTEYSSSENMIQPSVNTYCPNFKKNPCPIFYRSTDAYKCKLFSVLEMSIVLNVNVSGKKNQKIIFKKMALMI